MEETNLKPKINNFNNDSSTESNSESDSESSNSSSLLEQNNNEYNNDKKELDNNDKKELDNNINFRGFLSYLKPIGTVTISTFLCLQMTVIFLLLNILSHGLSITFKSWNFIMKYTHRKRTIKDSNNNDYLERYYVFLKDRSEFPFNIFVHKFLISDTDDLHNHPWSYFTFIIKGGYWEETFVDNNTQKEKIKKWCGPGFFQYVSSDHIHKITLKKNVDCWTLFIPFARTTNWGFYKFNGKGYTYISHENYKKKDE